jgi:hypothetical protein
MVFAPMLLHHVAVRFEQRYPHMFISFERAEPQPFFFIKVNMGLRTLETPVCSFTIHTKKTSAKTFERILEMTHKRVMMRGARL